MGEPIDEMPGVLELVGQQRWAQVGRAQKLVPQVFTLAAAACGGGGVQRAQARKIPVAATWLQRIPPRPESLSKMCIQGLVNGVGPLKRGSLRGVRRPHGSPPVRLLGHLVWHIDQCLERTAKNALQHHEPFVDGLREHHEVELSVDLLQEGADCVRVAIEVARL